MPQDTAGLSAFSKQGQVQGVRRCRGEGVGGEADEVEGVGEKGRRMPG